jgi:hypothetical protein
VSKEENQGSLSNVQSGDVLVSHPSAVREHEIRIVPNAPHAIAPTHDAAVSDGRSEADALGVDAWLTEDHTHVVKIASNRTSANEEGLHVGSCSGVDGPRVTAGGTSAYGSAATRGGPQTTRLQHDQLVRSLAE